MNTPLNPQAVKQLLNRSVADLDAATLNQLRASRTAALTHRRIAHTVPVLAGMGATWSEAFHVHKLGFLLVSLVLVVGLFSGAAYWQHAHDYSEVDIAILTDDLPVDVYVD